MLEINVLKANTMEWKPVHPLVNLTIAYLRYVPDHFTKLRIVRGFLKLLSPEGILVENSMGARLLINFNDYIAWSIINTGFYEGKSIELAASLLKNGGVFLDIGANFGLWTCALGVLPQVKCLCVEPFAINFLGLQRNLSLNPTIQHQLFNIALADFEGMIEMECTNSRNLGTARVVVSRENSSALKHAVSTTTLNSLLKFSEVDTITLMKIDVEGYELPILMGMDWQSNLRPKHIILEFVEFPDPLQHSEGKGRKDILKFMFDQGYQGQTIDGQELDLDKPCLEGNAYFRDMRCLK
ncbi:MAG: FkbM family methyltransferase [Pseudanabaenaceae cyanobacterium]